MGCIRPATPPKEYDGSLALAVLIAVLIGVATGAEGDLLAYRVSRYFGLKNYGALYGVAGGVFGLGMAIAPLAAAASFDYFGSYANMLILNSVVLLISAILLAKLS